MKNESTTATEEKALPRYDTVSEILSVCCRCYPGLSVLSDYPQFTGFALSHGYCPRCAAIFLAEFKALKSRN